jgi:hypothetical protein
VIDLNLLKKDGKKRPVRRHLFDGLSLMVTVILLSSCAAPSIRTTALVPARFHEATKIREVAVLPFDGHTGREFSAEIEGTITSIHIDNKQYFTLIDRTRLNRILKEQELSQTGLVDERWAVKVGKIVGAKGIYAGVITAATVKDNPYTEKRQECSEKEILYDKKGNTREGNCLKWRTYQVPCLKRDAIFAFTPKLIEVETGKVIYSRNLSQMQSAQGCQDSGTPLPSGVELLKKAKGVLKAAFKRDIAPFYVTFEIKLMNSEEGVTSKEAVIKLSQGMEYAQNNRFDRACELWGEGRILSPNAPALLYNLGICGEVRGDFGSALDLLRKADRALNKPNDLITAGIGRVSEAIKKQQTLNEQIK